MFVIEDESHSEWQGKFATRDEAIEELKRRAAIPWNERPNVAPCRSWRTCGRRYDLVEYDIAATPWKVIRRERILEISAAAVKWLAHTPGHRVPMLHTLEPEAQELATYMSELSEQAYYAGWMQDLEFALWDAVVNGPRNYGHLMITAEHVDTLRRLSEAARGWIVFDDKEEQIVLPMKSWNERFAAWKTRTNR